MSDRRKLPPKGTPARAVREQLRSASKRLEKALVLVHEVDFGRDPELLELLRDSWRDDKTAMETTLREIKDVLRG